MHIRRESTRFISSYKIIVGVVYIMLLSLMPIEEAVKKRFRTDCLNFDVTVYIQINKQISIRGRHWDYTFVGF